MPISGSGRVLVALFAPSGMATLDSLSHGRVGLVLHAPAWFWNRRAGGCRILHLHAKTLPAVRAGGIPFALGGLMHVGTRIAIAGSISRQPNDPWEIRITGSHFLIQI